MTHDSGYPFDPDENVPVTPQPEINQVWMVTFSDLMSLMLAFFVMLFSMSQLQTQAWKSIVTGLSDKLSPGRERSILEIEKDARPFRVLEPKGIDLGYLEAVIREKFRNHPVLANVRINSRADRIVIALPVDLLFQPEKAEAADNASVALEAIGQSLASIKNRIEIHVYSEEGERPALSDPDGFGSVWDLSLSRALTITKLFARSGLSLSVIPVGHSVAPSGSEPATDLVELVIRELGA